jgi:hypothetical protein
MTRGDELTSLVEEFARPRSPRALEIAGIKTSWGSPAGIYGARPCQLCGVLDCYRGFAVTLYVAHVDGDLVCRRCQDAIIPQEIFGITTRHKILKARLPTRTRRFCECCASRNPAPRKASTDWGHRLCTRCLAVIEGETVEDLHEFLLMLRRVRYIDLACDSPQALGAFGRRMSVLERRSSPGVFALAM